MPRIFRAKYERDGLAFCIMSVMPAIISIILVMIMTAGLGSIVTSHGMKWYKNIDLPPFTPPGEFIGSVWSAIYVLTGVSAYIFWHTSSPDAWRTGIYWCFIANALLNILWSAVFFRWHAIGWAFIEGLFLGTSVVLLIILLLPYSFVAAMLLVPYALWVLFASFLTFTIWQVNK